MTNLDGILIAGASETGDVGVPYRIPPISMRRHVSSYAAIDVYDNKH
jgi:hypothetical protein